MKNLGKMIKFTIVSLAVLALTGVRTYSSVNTAPGIAPAQASGETETQGAEIVNSLGKEIFLPFSGTVKEITNYVKTDGTEVADWVFVLLENEEGSLTRFLVNDETYLVTADEIIEGAEATVLYNTNVPHLMIYPPQFNAAAIAVNLPEYQSIYLDRFDKDFLSYDKGLKLNISDKTEIILQDGQPFDREQNQLSDRKMLVVYTVTTRSIPPQTSPDKVVVLFEKAIAPLYELPNGDRKIYFQEDDIGMPMIVGDRQIDAPAAYISDNGVTMVPVRSVAEALGYTVTWNDEDKSIEIGDIISLIIGNESYINLSNISLALEEAPRIVDGLAYVPLSFFRDLISLGTVR